MTDQGSDGFGIWMAEQLGAEAMEIEGWVGAEEGYSNETAIFDARVKRRGVERAERFVRRSGPRGPSMFKEYDLKRQYDFMNYLGKHSSLPVPTLAGLALDLDPPCYVMGFIEGEIPGDGHTAEDAYLARGFLFDGTPSQRRRYFVDLVTRLAELHQVPVEQDFAEACARPRTGSATTALQAEVDWWVDLYHWGKDGHDVTLASDKYVDWVASNAPALDDADIVWGDARPANTIARDYSIVALLDWELASFGPGEIDLFFHIAMHNHRQAQEGANWLEGVPSEAEHVEIYERATGRRVRHADFFRAFAYTRMAIISLIFCKANGIAPDEVPYDGSFYMDQLHGILGI